MMAGIAGVCPICGLVLSVSVAPDESDEDAMPRFREVWASHVEDHADVYRTVR